MNNHQLHPWFGPGAQGGEESSLMGNIDPKPLYNEKSQRDQDKALQNPEESIDKDPDKPWVQGNERPSAETEPDKNNLPDNGDPPIDEPVDPRIGNKKNPGK